MNLVTWLTLLGSASWDYWFLLLHSNLLSFMVGHLQYSITNAYIKLNRNLSQVLISHAGYVSDSSVAERSFLENTSGTCCFVPWG